MSAFNDCPRSRSAASTGTGGSTDTGAFFAFQGKDTNRFGANPEELNVFVDEASVTLNELFNPGLKLTVGIVPVSFDIRGKGSAFFFDPRHSSTFEKNVLTLSASIKWADGTGVSLAFAGKAPDLGALEQGGKDPKPAPAAPAGLEK